MLPSFDCHGYTNTSQATISLEEQTKDVLKEIEQLKCDKSILESKIKGYHGLGQRYLEKKSEVEDLQKQKNQLENRLKELEHTVKTLSQQQEQGRNIYFSSQGIQTSLLETISSPNSKLPPQRMTSLGAFSIIANGDIQEQTKSNSSHDKKYFESLGTMGPANDKYVPPNTPSANQNKFSKTFPPSIGKILSTKNRVESSSNNLFDSLAMPQFPGSSRKDSSSDFQHISSNEDLILFSTDPHSITYPPQHERFQINIEDIGNSLTLLTHQLSSHSNASEDVMIDGPVHNLRGLLQQDIFPMVAKIEQEIKEKQDKIDTVLKENAALRSEVASLNKQLETQNRVNRHTQESLPKGTSEPWNFVEKSEVQNMKSQSSKTQQADAVAALKEENEKLKDANCKWNAFHEKLLYQHKQNIRNLREELEKVNHGLQMELKETSAALDEARSCLEEEKFQVNKQQEKIQELNRQIKSITAGENHHCVECAISKVKGMRHDLPSVQKTKEELELEIEALRQQVTVFQEDFAQERNDRAAAKSEIESLKTDIENITRKNSHLTGHLEKLKKKLSSAEANLRQTTSYNQRVNEEKESLKRELLKEREMHNKIKQEYGQIKKTLKDALTPKLQGESPLYGAGVYQGTGNRISQPQTDPYATPAPPYYAKNKKLQGQVQRTAKPKSNLDQILDEQLPGAWTCNVCTLKNHPSRTVCEICSNMRSEDLEEDEDRTASQAELYQRGKDDDKIVTG